MSMKKSIGYVLASSFLFGFYSIGFANSNPFADVPMNHWSYDATEKLIQKGIVTGYDDKSFKDKQILTRSEIAVIVAKAMSKKDTADPETKALIDRLVTEYAQELRDIGVRETGTVETKADRFSFNGTARVRFDKGHTDGTTVDQGNKTGTYSPGSHLNLDINYAYKVNDNWSLVGESEFGRTLNYAGENETLQNSVFEQFYMTGPVADTTIKAGRFSAYSPFGLVYDDKVTGGQVAFGKVLKTTIQGGTASSTDDSDTYDSQNFASILFDLPISPISNVHAGYYKINPNTLQHQEDNGDYVDYYTLGFDSQLTSDWNLKAAYSKSNAVGSLYNGIKSTDTKAYLLKLTYKNADMNKPGSYDYFALYRKSPQLASYSNTDDWRQNVKGIRLGMDYILDKNVGFTTWYTIGKDIDTKAQNNEYRVEFDFSI